MTCVYGEVQVTDRHKTWEMLKFIKASSHLPWLCIGGSVKYSFSRSMKECRNQTSSFWEMLDVCRLVDLGFEGRRWTFEKKVVGGSYCCVRMDWALACTD